MIDIILKRKLLNRPKGFSILIIVLSVGTVALLITLTTLRVGIEEAEVAFVNERGEKVWAIAEACAEETLRRWQLDSNYSVDSFNLDIGGGACSITTTATSSERTVSVSANLENYHKKIFVEAIINQGDLDVVSWKEIIE